MTRAGGDNGWSARARVRVGSFTLDVSLRGGAGPVAVIGPNGSGKTTLLRTIAGIYRASEGRIRVGGSVLLDTAEKVCLRPEERRLGYVPQRYALFPHLSVVDNVAFGLKGGVFSRVAKRHRRRHRRSECRATARKLLDGMGYLHLGPRNPSTLSGGERQRIALARALLPSPGLLLLDEPMAALDAVARHDVRRFLAAHLTRSAVPALVVTHSPGDIRAMGIQTVYVLDGGRVLQSGAPSRLASRPASDFVAHFFGAEELLEGPPGGAATTRVNAPEPTGATPGCRTSP